MLRLYLDENISLVVAEGLRRRGVDVVAARDAKRLGDDDRMQLAFATAENRVLATFDDDFLAIAASGIEHAGIAYCHSEKYTKGELIYALLVLCNVMSAGEMKNYRVLVASL